MALRSLEVELQLPGGGQRLENGERHVGIDPAGAVAHQQGDVHRFAHLAALDDHGDLRTLAAGYQVVVHGRHGQQRGDGGMRGIDAAVAEDHIVVSVVHRLLRGPAQFAERLFERRAVAADREEHRQRDRPEPLVLQMAQDVQIAVRNDRRGHHHHLAQLRRGFQNVLAHGADVARQRHDQLLADGVHRRVGDLGELLAEEIEESLGFPRQHGDRRVVAHRNQRSGRSRSHRPDDAVDLLPVVAEGAQQLGVILHLVRHAASAGDVFQKNAVVVQPLVIGMFVGQPALYLVVEQNLPLLGIDHDDLARLQTPFRLDIGGRNVQHARLGGDDHQPVARDEITGRAQAVAVEHAARITAVGEDDGRRTVPGSHEDGVVFVKALQLLRERVLLVEALRNEHRQRMRQRHAAAQEKFERIVERRAVAHPRLDDRPEAALRIAGELGVEHRLARPHPEPVAADGVDLAVVPDQPEGLREAPRREGIGRKTRMHQSDGARKVGALQIGEVVAQLAGGEHPLVDDRPGRETDDVAALLVADGGAGQPELDPLADDVEQLFEPLAVVAPHDEKLPDDGLRRRGVGAEDRTVNGNVARRRQTKPLLLDDLRHQLHEKLLVGAVARQEDHADAVTPFLGHGNAVQQNEFMGNLHQNTRAVAGLVVRAFGSAVRHMLEDAQPLFDDRMVFVSVDVDDESDAAGVMLAFRAVQSSVRHSLFSVHRAT